MLIRPAIAFASSLAFTLSVPAGLASPAPSWQFGQPEALNSPTTHVRSILAFDATEDGLPDIVTTSSAHQRVMLFPSVGPGRFGLATTALQLVGPGPVSIEEVQAADFNGDGRQDLLLRTYESTSSGRLERLSVALATGAGLWSDPLAWAQAPSATLIPTVVDFDGDGLQDLLYSLLDHGISSQEIRFQRGRGDGTFEAAVVLSVGPGIQSGLRGVADFDGDGDLDVLDAPEFASLGYRRNDGAAGLAPRVPFVNVLFSRLDPVIADVDADGDLDIVQGSDFFDAVVLYLNDGLGQFSAGAALPSLPSSGNLNTAGAAAMAPMDVDLDGRVDLVFALNGRDEILWYRALGGAAFAAPVTLAQGLGARASLLAVADVDGDGRKDLAVGDYLFDDGPAATRVVYHRNGGAGAGLEDPIAVTSSAFGAGDLMATDLDGDGDEELFFLPQTTGAVTAMENLGFAERGGFGVAQELEATFPLNERVVAGDLDGDGDQDFVTRSTTESYRSAFFVIENRGVLGFGAPSMLSDASQGEVELGDFDGDGDLDVALGAFFSQVTILENVGGLQFVAGAPLTVPGLSPRALIAGDLTNDGIDDLVVLSEAFAPRQGYVTLLPGSSAGLGAQQLLLQEPSPLFHAAIADLNGDGLADLAIAGENGGGLLSIAGRPGGQFDSAVTLAPGSRYRVGAADIDLDGTMDLVASGYLNGTVWLRGLGLGSFATPVFLHAADRFTLVDVELDGDRDLVLLESELGDLWVLENTTRDRVGIQLCAPAVPNSTGASGRIEALGTARLAENRLLLRARSLPLGVPGLFLAARTTGVTFPVVGSEGRLCLSGPIGRFVGPDEVQDSGSAGRFSLAIEPMAMPTPGGFVSAMVGEDWYFQAWHRDVGALGNTTNFTDAVAVTWQ